MNVTIIPFVHYSGVEAQSVRDLWRFMKPTKSADQVYVINSGEALHDDPSTFLINAPVQSHWDSLDTFLPQLLNMFHKDDNVLLIDCDTIIYDYDKIKQYFDLLRYAPVVTTLDGSGGFELGSSFTKLRENDMRGEVRRFAPYFFMAKVGFLQDTLCSFAPTNFDPENWFDSMGQYTMRALSRLSLMGESFIEVTDDRWTSHFNDGDISQTNFSFEGKGNGLVHPETGWYHIRNFGHGLRIRDTFLRDREEFVKLIELMPQNELLRLLMWVEYISPSVPQELLELIHIDIDMWKRYKRSYLGLYPWLGERV